MDKTLNPHTHWYKIKCPYFKNDSFNSLNCEGCTQHSYIRQAFESKFDKSNWQKKYCMELSQYKSCPIFKAVDLKYENGE